MRKQFKIPTCIIDKMCSMARKIHHTSENCRSLHIFVSPRERTDVHEILRFASVNQHPGVG